MRPRHIAGVVLVLGLTVAGFIVTRSLAARDARHESTERAEIAVAQMRSRVEGAASLTESLRRFMTNEGVRGVTNDEFAMNAVRWLSPADLPAAAWAEQVGPGERAEYERRIGRPIASPDDRHRPVAPGSSYLPATLVSGFPPMDSRGMDLKREAGIAAALARAFVPGGVGATPVEARRDGTRGLFLVAPAPNVIDGVFHPGAVVVFLSEATLRAAARNPAGLRFPPPGRSPEAGGGGNTVRKEFTVAGQRFPILMPKKSVSGAGAALPWIILAAGLVLAGLAAALGTFAARRAKAQEDLDRIFTLSPDMITVADFEGRFTRVNPAVERILGYTEEEAVSRPYLDFVHPEDRERTVAEADAIMEGQPTLAFENRFVAKDGSYKALEWTAAPVVEQRLMYGVARDVTERRRAETEVERLAEEQAALRRVATLVAEGASAPAVFDSVSAEMNALLRADGVVLSRYEQEAEVTVIASRGPEDSVPVGSRIAHEGENVTTMVRRTGRPARKEDWAASQGRIGDLVEDIGVRVAVGAPVVVDGRLWGVIVAYWAGAGSPPPSDTEARMTQFAQLVDASIANADSREQLKASRARLVAAGDEARRRVVRDLHDGAQQRLVHAIVLLKEAARALRENDAEAESLIGEALAQATEANAELRELAQGVMPAVLTRGGLAEGVGALVSRSPVPVAVTVPEDRFSADVEATAYFVVAEALTNVAKHAGARSAEVNARVQDGVLRVAVQDDGIGGADREGSGLLGLADRIAALDGDLKLESPPGGGTRVTATIPLPG
ncbi:MAG TPA: PAS domain S-box protein [Thermoleophilaceae bacterium]